MMRAWAISLPAGAKNNSAGGPNRLYLRISALSSALLAVTSTRSSVQSGEATAHRGVAQGEGLELLAGDAPVGVEVDHHGAARRLHRGVERGQAGDACETAARSPHAQLQAGLPLCRRSRRRNVLQRLQQIAPAGSHARDLQHRHHREQQAGALGQGAPRRDAIGNALERTQIDRRDRAAGRRRRSISAHAGSTGDTIQSATASSITPKKCFTRSIQPPARGSSEPGRQAHQQQRHAHARGQREQSHTAERHVARLADVDQRAGQRRGDARPDDQRRQRRPSRTRRRCWPPCRRPETSVMRLCTLLGICNS